MTLLPNRRLLALVALVSLTGSSALAGTPASAYRAYLDGPWGQIHVRVSGAQHTTTVVLLHQMVWSSLQFEYVQPILAARGVRSIAVDLPGYGLSDGPDHVPSAEEYADALLPVLDHFALKKVILHGNHTGATIAVAFATPIPGGWIG